MIRELLLSSVFALVAANMASASPQDQKEALAALQPEIADYQKNCPDTKIKVDSIKDAPLTPSKNAVVIILGESVPSFCFGNTVPAYLVTPTNGKWKVFGTWLGGVEIKPLAPGQQAATIIGYAAGMCHVTHLWRGNRYVAVASRDCKGFVKQRDIDATAAELTKTVLH